MKLTLGKYILALLAFVPITIADVKVPGCKELDNAPLPPIVGLNAFFRVVPAGRLSISFRLPAEKYIAGVSVAPLLRIFPCPGITLLSIKLVL